jgi:hypothetical protein
LKIPDWRSITIVQILTKMTDKFYKIS